LIRVERPAVGCHPHLYSAKSSQSLVFRPPAGAPLQIARACDGWSSDLTGHRLAGQLFVERIAHLG
jgi:hypothetical protein